MACFDVAIAQLSVEDAIEATPLSEATVRFTLDMEPADHEAFSILAVKLRRRKAELVKWAIARLLQETGPQDLQDLQA